MSFRDEMIQQEKNWPFIQKAWNDGCITKREKELSEAGILALTPKKLSALYPTGAAVKKEWDIYPGRRQEILLQKQGEVLVGLADPIELDWI